MDACDVSRRRWAAARGESAAVAKAWRRSAEWLHLVDAFDASAAASLPIARDRAMALFGDANWTARLLAPLAAALAADPLFEPPLKVSRDRGQVGAMLFDAPAARVAARILSARMLAAHPASEVVVPGYISVTRYVRAGDAQIRRWRVENDVAREIVPLWPHDGDIVLHDGRVEGQVIARAKRDVVTVTAILRAGTVPLMREFGIADGRRLRSTSTDEGASRTAMLLTLLRVSGRADAGAAFEAATHDPAAHARWSAMREWLATDADAAVPRLGIMAQVDPDADVRRAARATLALVERRRAACHA